jgi:6-pyruvoyltetrahydropterin/6-carboxytetrahydropterin synthase
MYTLERTYTFSAGHEFPLAPGMCNRPHGHTFELRVILKAAALPQSGAGKHMIVDLLVVDGVVKPMIDRYFEHRWLNDTLETDAPSLEFAACWIYNYLKPHLPPLHSIVLGEDGISYASFTADE